jgi:tRNA pseudouridine38-40 synthase
MDVNNIKLILSYDGSLYHGWQRQDNGVTIQGVIEEKIEAMTGEPVTLIASGRTDAGVHALNQVCNFTTRSRIDPKAIKAGLNSMLPDDIVVTGAQYVPMEFHARYSVRSKVYEYRILNTNDPDVFLRNYTWHIRRPLDKDEMTRCLSVLTGTHDFSSFKSAGSGNTNPVRSVSRAELYCLDNQVRIIMEADGFLRHMVRNIVGTVVEAGMGRRDALNIKKILEARDRRRAGRKAPAQGLFLASVIY